jgi:putative ABC transport system permease protein
MIVSFIILAIVGIVSGLLPAVRAAKMDPVVALRHE